MMIPVLVAPPVTVPVELADLKDHLRVNGQDFDAKISALAAAAVGKLDGWRGELGRAIMPQTWRIEVAASGDLVLPMPDVSVALANYGGDDEPLAIRARAGGPTVTVTGAGHVDFTCAMPGAQLDAVGAVIKMIVDHWFYPPSDAALSEIPASASALIAPLRWRSV